MTTRMHPNQDAKTNLISLPSGILLLILSRLDHSSRLTLSLVSKYFRLLADTSFHKLKFYDRPSDSTLRKLFSRFTSITQISIMFCDGLDRALIEISQSQLNIQKLKISGAIEWIEPAQIHILSGQFPMVKSLKLFRYEFRKMYSDASFIRLFPSLEELDISRCNYWTDAGIENLALNLTLRKINIVNSMFLTDKSLKALSNCVQLEDINFAACHNITLQGMGTFVGIRKNLKSLNLPYYPKEHGEQDDGILTFAENISDCENLTHLSISGGLIRDDLLSIIAKSRSCLTKLSISLHKSKSLYTMEGVSAVLRAFQGLTSLCVSLPKHSDTQDTEMSKLVESLPRLNDISLFFKYTCYATLFSLIQNCPVLEDIKLHFKRSGGTHCDVPQGIKTNYTVQHVVFYTEQFQPGVIPGVKTVLKSICPALKTFNKVNIC